MFNLTRKLMEKGLTYPQALKVTRRVLETRRTREFYSLEFSSSYVILYTEWGGEFVFPTLPAALKGRTL